VDDPKPRVVEDKGFAWLNHNCGLVDDP